MVLLEMEKQDLFGQIDYLKSEINVKDRDVLTIKEQSELEIRKK